jgi:murein DD-endopeptidase MepM/ murein hydrolase activator NlpD
MSREGLIRTLRIVSAAVMLAAAGVVALPADPAQAARGAMHQPTRGTVTSRINDRCPGTDNHDGIDIADARNTPVYAAYRGRVTFAGTMSGYGQIVIISHPRGYETRYAHLDGFRVSVGQRVRREQRIGRMGDTGIVTGVHLHFEVRRNGAVHTPLNAAYACDAQVRTFNRIRARFPDLPA